MIQEFEENNSGVDLFHFDSDEDVFCVYSQYIDDLIDVYKRQEYENMSLKYTCPSCGTPLGYEGLCWKCKCEQERQAALAWICLLYTSLCLW